MNDIKHDALRVWLDFWELTGARRFDIIKGEKTITALPVILLEDARGNVLGRDADLDFSKIKLEVIDVVNEADLVGFNGKDYKIEGIEERDVGSFSMWIILAEEVKDADTTREN